MLEWRWCHARTHMWNRTHFLALGMGLLLSLLIPGWFARALVGAVLIGIGCLAGCCT